MTNITLKIEGMEKLAAKLKSLEDVKYLKTVMRAAGETIKAKIAVYPPATEANAPSSAPGARWYQRGQGGHYIRKRDGGESIYRTSETLGRKWTTALRDAGLTVIVGNKVTYAPHVQDREKQAAYHKRRGWLTIQDVAEQNAEQIAQQVMELLVAKLEK